MRPSLKYIVLVLLLGLQSGFLKAQQDTVLLVPDSLRQAIPDSIATQTVLDTAVLNKAISPKQTARKDTLTPPPLSSLISTTKIVWSLLFILTGYVFIWIAVRVINFFAEKSVRYRILLKGIIPVVRTSGWIIVIFLIIKAIIQPPLATFLAVSASVGVAVGFAAQDILKNVFGGFIILLERPFYVGDKIEVAGQYGEVIEIGLRSIRMVTADDSVIVIPNGELMNKSISNSNSGESNCQVVAEIFLPIDVDTAKARSIALEVAKTSKYVYLRKPVVVLFFNEIKQNRSYLKMRLKAYVYDIREEFAFKSDMTEIVIRELLQQNVIKKQDLM